MNAKAGLSPAPRKASTEIVAAALDTRAGR